MTDLMPERVDEVVLPDPRPADPLEALSWLGETEEEVVRALRERGIKGKRMSARSCPLHNYLAEFGWDIGVCAVLILGPTTEDNPRMIATPPVLKQFMCGFDYGAYPDLIAD